jgi:transcriptional activator protein Pur-alpha
MVMTRGPRAQIAIPAQGLIEFKDHLAELLEQFGGDAATAAANEEQNTSVTLPDSKSLRADNKTFYFDCGSNSRGIFLRLSEVRSNRYRSSITVPEKFWDQFVVNMREFIEKIESGKVVPQPSSEEVKASGENNAPASN